MGYVIDFLKKIVFSLAKESPFSLRVGGFAITVILVLTSGFSGWLIEQLCTKASSIPTLIAHFILVVSLSSSLAYKSLNKSVLRVINYLDNDLAVKDLKKARKELRSIVGRDVDHLSEAEILRAAAETASENSVDGIFGPLFWIFVGAISWKISSSLPGPLAFAWVFKASSTMDSMIGYRQGRLKWLGTASARLDDILTFIPCRLVVITLPLISIKWGKIPYTIRTVFTEGRQDTSPNSGLSEAVFAHCLNIRLGGDNLYNNELINKPIFAKDSPEATCKRIRELLNLSLILELTWAVVIAFMLYIL